MRIFIHVFSRAFRILILSLSLSSKERETRDERERERDVAPPSSPPKTAIHEIYSVVKSIFFLFKKREKRERERERERVQKTHIGRIWSPHLSPICPRSLPMNAMKCILGGNPNT